MMERKLMLLGSLICFLVMGCTALGTHSPGVSSPLKACGIKVAQQRVSFADASNALIEFEFNVANPNEFLVTVESMSMETYLEDFRIQEPVDNSPISTFYIPGSKAVSIKNVVFIVGKGLAGALLIDRGIPTKEATDLAEQIVKRVKEGGAKWRIEGIIQVSSNGSSMTVPFSIRP